MTENTTPLDAETFDLSDWITGGKAHRPVKTVTVYRDLSLNAEVEAIKAKLEALDAVPTDGEGNPEESLGGDDEQAALEAEAETLLARMRSAKVTLKITGLIRPEIEEIQKRLKPKGLDQSSPEYDYAVLAKACEFPGGQHITAEQWRAFHDAIGQGQFTRIIQTYQAAMMQVPDVTAPFSRTSSSRNVNGR